jgi:beta-galactosidase
MKKATLLIVAGFLTAMLPSTAQNADIRQNLLIDRDWKFSFGHAGDPAKDFNFGTANIYAKSGKAEGTAIDPKFDDRDWRNVDLPHDWAVELPFVFSRNFDVQSHGYKPVGGLFPETSIGWYRKRFAVPASDSGMRFSIRFDGVFRDAQFWLNGFYLGRNESGYVGVTWDITDYIRFSKENILVVRVDATQYEGWFYEGAGIYRHVWLERRNPLHLAENGIFVSSEIKGDDAEVTIEATVRNDHAMETAGRLQVAIKDRYGKLMSAAEARPVNVRTGATEVITQRITIKNARLWSPDDPWLYRAVVSLRSANRTVDSTVVRFGVRTVRFDADSGFFLNGKNMKIHGVCCHQDHAGVGSALPDFLQYYRISLLKEMGVNAYRTSHNAPTPELLDACDSLGMLVMDEQRLLNSSPEYMGQFERLIRRDRNHPCVFIWSIGNEEGYIQTTGTGKRIALSLMTRQKELDPTRTCTYAADLPNVFDGINEVIPVRAFNYRQYAVADYHKSHPDQPVTGTEMGSTVTTRGIYAKDTVRCYLPDQDITAPWWASTAEQWWTLCANQPWWTGGFVWTGFDYRGEPTPFQWPNINSHFGILDMCGFPKNIYYYYQSWWTDKDVLHISPQWNLQMKTGEPVRVWVNSNADKVELFLNGKSFGKKEMPRNGHLEWEVPYHPGKVEAVAWKGKRKFTAQIETTGEPARIVLSPAKSVIAADGLDGTVVDVSVMDEKGREVPDAANLIRFTLKGDAKIIGVGNGDPGSHEPDKAGETGWQRSLFSGKCQLIIQSGLKPGTIEIEAGSEGMTTARISIVSM